MRQTGARRGEKVRFSNTLAHTKCFPHSYFHLEVGGKQKLEVSRVLFPGAEEKEDEEERFEGQKGGITDHRCNCILSLAYVASHLQNSDISE